MRFITLVLRGKQSDRNSPKDVDKPHAGMLNSTGVMVNVL